MRVFGGKYYWGRKEETVEGIVVIFPWMASNEKHVKKYVDLYSSLGWNSFVCHSNLLNLLFPTKAASLAFEVLSQLLKELKIKPQPIVFVSFSGGPKAVMYKLLQIIEGECQHQGIEDDYRLVKACLSGYIFDSCPVDFIADAGIRATFSPTTLKMSRPPPLTAWILGGAVLILNALFHKEFELQRADYWKTLYSTTSMGVPYLILCSEDDGVALYSVISNFAQRLQEVGADVNMVKWATSPHVRHFQSHPLEYEKAVSEMLLKVAVNYSREKTSFEGFLESGGELGTEF